MDNSPVPANQPLACEVVDDQIVIRVGMNAIKWAAEAMPECNPRDEATGKSLRIWYVTNPLGFAKDVRRALMREGEDGATLLTRLMDKACLAAVDEGSLGVRVKRHSLKSAKAIKKAAQEELPTAEDAKR